MIKTITRIERTAELAETAPSFNACVATTVARPFTTTVKGRKTAFRKEDEGCYFPGFRNPEGSRDFN